MININRLGFSFIIILLMTTFSQLQAAEPLSRRNPYSITNFVESEHFAVYWGEGVTNSSAQELLDILETAWRRLIGDLGFERPITTQSYKLNIYISGTGGVPYDDEQGGFAILDDQLHEAFILNKNALDNSEMFLGATHEFFHTIQSSYGLIRSDAMRGVGWLGEALANWSVPATWLEADTTARNALAQYAFYPQYSLDHINPYKEGENYYLLSGHQYGTYIFFDHLTEKTNDPDFVLNFLEYLKPVVAATKNKDALTELRLFVELNYGLALDKLFASFIARNTNWDYPQGIIYRSALDRQRRNFPDERIAQSIWIVDNQWHEGPQETLPRRWAANYIKLNISNSAELEDIELAFEGNTLGSFDNESDWQVTAVVIRNGLSDYFELDLQEGKIENALIPVVDADSVWLAISVTNQTRTTEERFAYRYQFATPGFSQSSPETPVQYVYDAPIDAPIKKENSTSGGGSVNLILLALVLFCRRKAIAYDLK